MIDDATNSNAAELGAGVTPGTFPKPRRVVSFADALPPAGSYLWKWRLSESRCRPESGAQPQSAHGCSVVRACVALMQHDGVCTLRRRSMAFGMTFRPRPAIRRMLGLQDGLQPCRTVTERADYFRQNPE